MDKSCMCIACDVKDSRKLDKERLQNSLLRCAEQLNNEWKDQLLVPFAVRNGDELIGVVEKFSSGYSIAEQLISLLEEDDIFLYIGLGLGLLETSDSTIHTMNGSAVLNAMDARDRFLKGNEQEAKYWQVEEKASCVFFYADNLPYQALNSLRFSIQEKELHRSDKQREVIGLLDQNQEATYDEIGKKLGYKSPKSTVSYLLSRAQYQRVNVMKRSLSDLLDHLQQPLEKGGK